jgi:mannose-6-phosphate isomerase-like protein (cupin superfamily)
VIGMDEPGSIDFDALTREPEGPGIWSRATTVARSRWAVVDYEVGAGRHEWCEDGHRGYVAAGAIEYEFADGRPPLRVSAQQAFRLPPGPPHRGRNVGRSPVRLFLIDDPSP